MYTTVIMPSGMQFWGKNFPCKLRLNNLEDRFVVVVVRGEVTIGHVPKQISLICSSFEEGQFHCP